MLSQRPNAVWGNAIPFLELCAAWRYNNSVTAHPGFTYLNFGIEFVTSQPISYSALAPAVLMMWSMGGVHN